MKNVLRSVGFVASLLAMSVSASVVVKGAQILPFALP
jgi:hypothetical protein